MEPIRLRSTPLRVSHESELLVLRKQMAHMRQRLDELDRLMTTSSSSSTNSKIKITVEGGFVYVAEDDIIYCKAEGNYTRIVTFDSKFIVSKVLKSVEQLLSSTHFIRCHQSYLINKQHVLGQLKNNGGCVIMTNNHELPISRRNKKELLQKL